MARSVVTGAAGFLGGAIAHALRVRGDDVVGFDIRRGAGATQADTSRRGDWEQALDGADLVVHVAALATGGFADPSPVAGPATVGRASAAGLDLDEIWRVNVDGTAAVLAAAERAGVTRVVHLSSVAVLGNDGQPRVATDDPSADTIAAAERTVAEAVGRGLAATVVRVGDAYGPRAGRWTLRPVALMRAGHFALVDGGRGILSPVHVDDVTDAVLALADSKEAAGEVVTVAGPAAASAAEFFSYYLRMLDVPAPPSLPTRVARGLAGLAEMSRLPPAVPRGGLSGRLASRADPRIRLDTGPASLASLTRTAPFSSAAATALTGWAPRVGLDDGMARTEVKLRERGLLGVREPHRRG